MRRLDGVGFWGNGIEIPEFHRAWLGEYAWGASLEDFIANYLEYDRWPATNALPLTPTVWSYPGDYATQSGLVPSPRTLEVIQAHWAGRGFDYVDKSGELIAFSPEPSGGHNWTSCLVRQDTLVAGLTRHRLRVIWTVLAERSCWDGAQHVTASEGRISGVYGFDGKKICGGISNVYIFKMPQNRAA